MDREILFRGKRIDTGKWVEGSLISFGKNMKAILLSKTKAYRPKDTEFFCSINCCDVIPETVGQYTGIYDKNGRRIFEGDIVTIPNSKKQGLPAVIKWSQSETRFEISRMGYQPLPLDPLFSRNGYYSRCEIVGNIHDNPELLEGGE